MTAAERRKEEQESLLQSRKNRILESAFNLFSEKGIDTIAINDIAKKAEIGVASLYRYYETKDEIAIQTAIWAWKNQKAEILPKIENDEFSQKNGFEQLKFILNHFINLTETQKDFLRFIYFFDSYAVRQHIEAKRLMDYESEIIFVKELVLKAIDKGIEDKSISCKYKDSKDLLYFSIMHSLFSTAQKFSLSSSMLEIDKNTNPTSQLDFLINLILTDLKS